jgi:AcrR family transcriptional regulator
MTDELDDTLDGRRLRGKRSRAQIVEALFDLVRDGELDPSAMSVAARAGVGLRTVFRHFEDMDSLYREISHKLEAEILPMVMTPFESTNWRGKVEELILRRSHIYEYVMPLKIASDLRRFQSEFLMDDHKRFIIMERAGLQGVLPAAIVEDRVLFSALEMLTGFQTWRRLRQDQALGESDATAAIQRSVRALLPPAD